MVISASKPKKDHILSVRLNAEDKKQIFEIARQYKISASELLVRTVLDRPLPSSSPIAPSVKQTIEELTIETYKIIASTQELTATQASNNLLSELQNLAHKLNKLGCHLYGE